MPGPRRAWSYMRRQGRDCEHQSCAAVPSAYSTVVRHWLCSYSSQAQVPCVDLLAGPRLLLFGLLFVYLFGPLVVGCLLSPTVASRRPPECAVLVLSVLRFFVVFLRFVCLCWALVLGSSWTSAISSWALCFGRFSAFFELWSAR